MLYHVFILTGIRITSRFQKLSEKIVKMKITKKLLREVMSYYLSDGEGHGD